MTIKLFLGLNEIIHWENNSIVFCTFKDIKCYLITVNIDVVINTFAPAS